jgi:hypothetical protein
MEVANALAAISGGKAPIGRKPPIELALARHG